MKKLSNYLINLIILIIWLTVLLYFIYFATYFGSDKGLISIKTIMVITMFPFCVTITFVLEYLESLKN